MHSHIDLELDLTGLESPLPMLRTKDALDSLLPGQVVLVKTTAAGSEQNIRNLINNHPVKLLSLNKDNGVLHFLIEKAAVLAN
ncbi:sulfurtransferase TusA family protein [Methylophilus sp. 5]|uniref:sulfurtransferase TusA family protein n=1 Tax=Methylophilus sp. 5 TaxID=1112274 RepID=UPI000491D808|nr:sulfurtransferase TusA family protein [Methylophilus sp. 5]